MQSEESANRGLRESTEESSASNVWSEQHQVFYYSRFELFDSTQSEQEFYQFSIFLERVSSELGREWKKEAGALYSPAYTSREVFMTLVELWLSRHPPVNSHFALKSSRPAQATFNAALLADFRARVRQDLAPRCAVLPAEPPNTSLKAVCLGFFMTANQVWQQMFQEERKPESFSSNTFLRSVTSSLEKTFRPLMVVTEKIGSVFGRKKRKFNEEVDYEESTESKFETCYHEFKRTLDIEKQLERKMSDLALEDHPPNDRHQKHQRQQREEEAAKPEKVIEKKEFEESESPIQSSLIGSLYSYVSEFLQRNPSWQVASNFVTQILDLNQVRLEEGKRVKVMRPAQEFYKKLVMVWLMLQQDSEQAVSFPAYLARLKSTFFADCWQDKYIVPTKYFFERMRQDWQSIRQETLGTEKEVLNAFIRRVKTSMQTEWDRRIKIKEAQTH